MTDPSNAKPDRDWRAVIVICAGLFVVFGIFLIAAITLPGDVPTGQVNTKGANIASIASAAFAAVSSVVAAYFGVKAANLAREDSEKRGENHAIQVAHLAGAASPADAKQAIDQAVESIKELRQR